MIISDFIGFTRIFASSEDKTVAKNMDRERKHTALKH